MRVIWKQDGTNIPEHINKYLLGEATDMDVIQAGLPDTSCLKTWLALSVPKQNITDDMLPVNEDMIMAVCVVDGTFVSENNISRILSEMKNSGPHTIDSMKPFCVVCEDNEAFGFMASVAAEAISYDLDEDSTFASELRTVVDCAVGSSVEGVYTFDGIKTKIIKED